MGAPTWPPTPDEAHKTTLAEYGDAARKVLPQDEEEAERALLAPFLFGPPKRQLVAGEENGSTLDSMLGSLHGWLQMVSGRTFDLGYGDPASTDGVDIYLPRAVPAPVQSAEDALLFRTMGLLQAGMITFGFLSERRLLADLHTDWVLRSCYHLLAARVVIARWSNDWPGIARDFEAIRFLDKAGILRVNVTTVPRKGMPQAFLPLYQGLSDFLDPIRSPEAEAARRAIDKVDAIKDPRAAALVVAGQAAELRRVYKTMKLGAPPLPYFLGILRPEWILHDVRAEMRAEQEWKKGSKPLRQLLAKMAESPGGARKTAAFWGRRRRPDDPPSMGEIVTNEATPPPTKDDGREYDEWDADKNVYRVAFTKVSEVEGPSGSIEAYQRIVEANYAQVKEVRRRFEALRLEDRWIHGEPDGSEIDLGRAVAAMGELAAGHTPRRVDWYVRFQRARQSVAILTLVDLSGSTAGNVIRLEQEALVLFAEGLRVLRFPHATYGFANQGPRGCTLQRLKGWDEAYDESVFKRLGNIRAGGASRLGAYVRHAAWSLGQQAQSRRILLLVSDGRPEDRGEYRGRFGIRDTALAVQEASRQGILTFCVSLDRRDDAETYLAEIFGKNRYLVLDRVDDLPVRLPEVFRGLVR